MFLFLPIACIFVCCCRNQAAYEFAAFSDEEMEDETVYDNYHSSHVGSSKEQHHFASNIIEDDQTFNIESAADEELSIYSSPASMESNIPSIEEVVVEEKIPTGDNDLNSHENNATGPTLSSLGRNSKRNILDMSHKDDQTHQGFTITIFYNFKFGKKTK